MSLQIISRAELEETAINVDEGGNKKYRTELLLYYFQTMTAQVMSKKMLEKCLKFQIARALAHYYPQ